MLLRRIEVTATKRSSSGVSTGNNVSKELFCAKSKRMERIDHCEKFGDMAKRTERYVVSCKQSLQPLNRSLSLKQSYEPIHKPKTGRVSGWVPSRLLTLVFFAPRNLICRISVEFLNCLPHSGTVPGSFRGR